MKGFSSNFQLPAFNSIVGFDTGIKDNNYFLSEEFFTEKFEPFLKTILPEKDFHKSKIEIPEREQIKKIKSFLAKNNIEGNFTYGGTTANIFYNISSIIGNRVVLKFVATGKESLQQLRDNGIQIFLSDKSVNYAESVLFYLGEKREKRTLIYRGDFKKTISENLDSVASQIFQYNSLYMLMGSVLGKIGEENFSKIISKIEGGKNSRFTLNLPTDKDTAIKYKHYITDLIPRALIIFSNIEELGFIFTENFNEDESLGSKGKFILQKLQEYLSEGSHALITAGKYGAFLVSKTEYELFTTPKFNGKPYTNGAGDTTIGVYIAGLLSYNTPKKALQIAMRCAFEKLKFNLSRLPKNKFLFPLLFVS